MASEELANRITVNTAEQDDCIEAVTIFRSNQAEVKRRINLELKKGQNHVHIERLPSCLKGDSIRVDGTGTAVIFDVIYRSSYDSRPSSPDGSVVAAQRTLETLEKERDIAREQSNLLTSYGKTLDSKNVSIEDVQQFLDMFGLRQVAVAKRIQELDVQIERARGELNEAQRESYDYKQGEKRGARVTVTVLAEMDGKVELILKYVVSQLENYAALSSLDRSNYRGGLAEVALTLSTASPELGSNVPDLTPWKIGFDLTYRSSVEQAYPGAERRAGAGDTSGEDLSAFYAIGFKSAMPIRQGHVETSGVLSTTFGIPGRSDIPSDEGSHKVVVTVLDLQADPEWICVPRKKENVFLMCKVVNSSEFTLLPGEASVFMDDNFVSKSRIEHVSPNDSFKISLGVDSSLKVTYSSAKTLNRTEAQSGFPILARERQSVSAQSHRITIRNSRLTSVSNLRMIDHLPVSTDAKLKVNVIAPSGLDVQRTPGSSTRRNLESREKSKELPWASVQKGVKARWAPLDVGGEGTVEWRCDIGPSDELELDLAWEVSAPVGRRWYKF